MKNRIITALASIAIAFFLEYRRFLSSRDMLGCGMAPDGRTMLGPCYDFAQGTITAIIVAVIVFGILSCIIHVLGLPYQKEPNK